MQKLNISVRSIIAATVTVLVGACAVPGESVDDGRVGTVKSALREDVCLGGADTPSLVPQWRTAYTGSTLLGSELVEGTVTNTDVIDIPARIDVRMSGVDARVVSTTLWQGIIASGNEQPVSIRLDALPIRSYGVASVAEIVVTATDSPRTGDKLYSLPLYVEYDPGGATFSLTGNSPPQPQYLGSPSTYGDAVSTLLRAIEPITRRANGGEVLTDGSFVPLANLPANGSEAFDHDQSMTLSAADSTTLGNLFDYQGPSIDDGYAPMQVCAKFGSDYVDDGKGEAVSGYGLPARFAQATLGRANRLPDWSGSLDAAGCTPDLTLKDYTGYAMIVRTELDDNALGGSHRVHVHDSNGAIQTHIIGFSTLIVRRPTWYPRFAIRLGGFGSGDDQMRVAGVLGQVLYTFPWQTIVPGDYEVRNQRCNGDPSASTACYSPNLATLFIGPNLDGTHNSQYKFVVAHEFGHAIQDRASGLVNAVYTRDASLDETGPCGCGFVSDPTERAHCFQSQQRLGAAEIESYAHYVAANTWNGSSGGACNFVYYKNFREDDRSITKPPVAKSCSVPPKWIENHCLAAQRGVEWDWLTFFRSAGVSAKPVPLADVNGIFQQACGGTCSTSNEPTFGALRNAALAYFGGSTREPRYVAFQLAGINAGVDH